MQPPRPLLRRPADPLVPRRQLVRPRAPAQQRHPSAVRPLRHLPQAVADHAAEAQVVVVPHQRVPSRPLRLADHRAHRHPPHAARPRHPQFRPFRPFRHRRHDDNLATIDAVCLEDPFPPFIQWVANQLKLALVGQCARFITRARCGTFCHDRQREQSAWPRALQLADSNFRLPFRHQVCVKLASTGPLP